MNKNWFGIGCLILLGAGLPAKAADGRREITLNCASRIAIDFTTQNIIRGVMATQVGARITDASLGSDSRIEIQIEVGDDPQQTPRPYRVLRLLYDPFDLHYTVSTDDIPIRDEGRTGGLNVPTYYVTVQVAPRTGVPYVLVQRTVLDFFADSH
jgi:hypothetical protein